jgi:hypothetical protein
MFSEWEEICRKLIKVLFTPLRSYAFTELTISQQFYAEIFVPNFAHIRHEIWKPLLKKKYGIVSPFIRPGI